MTARGELAADERVTNEIFDRASPSVLFITTRQRVVNPWTRYIASAPRSNGAGIIWDDLGLWVCPTADPSGGDRPNDCNAAQAAGNPAGAQA